MWHEARKQEKKIRGMLVDYRKRADRRKEFYEKIKADPNQFLQVHGRKCKIHYEVTDMTDDMHMMPWQGQKDNLIDRFDVRTFLDYIPPPRKEEQQEEKITEQDRQVNYESYRVLAQNEFLGINESDFLRQIQMEEQFGSAEKGGGDSDKKKKNSQANAAIGYTYEDSPSSAASTSVPFSQQILSIETSQASSSRFEEFAKDYSDESDIDMDVQVDVKKIGTTQAHELNNFGKKYGMTSNDLFSYLTRDEEEKQSLKAMKEQEADKILGGGRKSRRERRSQREKRILGKPLTFSPPSYAAKEEKLQEEDEEESDKSSRESKSPSVEKITYITSFGGEEELQPHAKITIPFKKTMPKNLVNLRRNETFADKVRENSDKLRQLNESEKRKNERSRSRSSSRHRRRSRSSSRRKRYRSRSRSYSRRRYSRSRSRRRNYRHSSRSYSRSYSRSRSVSRGHYSSRRRSSSYRRRRSRDRRRSSSRERSRNRRRYSSSSSSSSVSSSSSSSSSHRSSTSSPEKRSHKEKSISREKSRSKTPIREKRASSSPKAIPTTSDVQPPPPVVKRYYGRKRDDDSSSSLSVDSDDNDDRHTGSNESSANDGQKVRSADIKIGLSKSTVGPPTISNPREKLKKKMQILLNKQYKADKKAETEKIERQMQQQQERDEEMRELAIKLRRRQRELRHKYGEENKDSNSNSESDENGSRRRDRKTSTSSTSSSSSDDDNKRRRSRSNSSSRYRKRFKTSISRSPVRYGARRSRSKSSGRNYRRRYSRSRSRDYRR